MALLRKYVGLSLSEIFDLELRQWQAYKAVAEYRERQEFSTLIRAVAFGSPGDEEKADTVTRLLKELDS